MSPGLLWDTLSQLIKNKRRAKGCTIAGLRYPIVEKSETRGFMENGTTVEAPEYIFGDPPSHWLGHLQRHLTRSYPTGALGNLDPPDCGSKAKARKEKSGLEECLSNFWAACC